MSLSSLAGMAAASLGLGLQGAGGYHNASFSSSGRGGRINRVYYDENNERRCLETHRRLYRREPNPPTRAEWERLEERRLRAEARAKARAAREQVVNPKYTEEPRPCDFPTRQQWRQAVRRWRKQNPQQET